MGQQTVVGWAKKSVVEMATGRDSSWVYERAETMAESTGFLMDNGSALHAALLTVEKWESEKVW